MDKQIALLGIIQIISALSCGVLILFLTYKIINLYGKKTLNITEKNTAYNILVAGILFSVGYIVNGVVQPILDSFRLLISRGITITQLIGEFIFYGGIYIAISYIAALLVTGIGIYFYTYITPINELREIKNNNIGVALVVSVVIIILSIFCKGGIILFIESLVPYPELPPN